MSNKTDPGYWIELETQSDSSSWYALADSFGQLDPANQLEAMLLTQDGIPTGAWIVYDSEDPMDGLRFSRLAMQARAKVPKFAFGGYCHLRSLSAADVVVWIDLVWRCVFLTKYKERQEGDTGNWTIRALAKASAAVCMILGNRELEREQNNKDRLEQMPHRDAGSERVEAPITQKDPQLFTPDPAEGMDSSVPSGAMPTREPGPNPHQRPESVPPGDRPHDAPTIVAATQPESAVGMLTAVGERAARRQAVVMPILAQKGWSRGLLAAKAGLGKNSVYEYLDGTRARITDDNRIAIADALELKPEQLPI